MEGAVICPTCRKPVKDWTPYRVNGSLSICFEHCGKHWQVNGVPFDLALAWGLIVNVRSALRFAEPEKRNT